MSQFHDILNSLTADRKNELYSLKDRTVSQGLKDAIDSEIAALTEFIYCCQACVPLDAPLDAAVIKPIQLGVVGPVDPVDPVVPADPMVP